MGADTNLVMVAAQTEPARAAAVMGALALASQACGELLLLEQGAPHDAERFMVFVYRT